MAFNADFNVGGVSLDTQMTASPPLGVSFGTVEIATDKYTGRLTVTPSDAEKIVCCEGLVMPGNVVVNPIPSNYGKITYSGFELHVE